MSDRRNTEDRMWEDHSDRLAAEQDARAHFFGECGPGCDIGPHDDDDKDGAE